MSLSNYLLHLADNALILGHRNSEWCGHGPVLEQDIALTNISLDLIGQSRYLYQYAAAINGNGASEDSLAFLRDARSYLNLLMLELPKGDWGFTILRQYLFSEFQLLQYKALQRSTDPQLAGIAEKGLKETSYHRRWSSEWVIRLGDGTDESHKRMQDSLAQIWPYTGEFFMPAIFEQEMAATDIGVDPSSCKQEWMMKTMAVLEEATLMIPDGSWFQKGGKDGRHTEHLGYLLAEMQFIQRAYPGQDW
jgi:ring-1,2-phenylacetyl-CoA epoxidase subunit PaaC